MNESYGPKLLFTFLFIFICLSIRAQDSIKVARKVNYKFNYKQIIIPATMIGIGVVGINSDWLKARNGEIKDEIKENIDDKFTIDDFSQYVPALSTYALNGLGIKGLHNFRDRTVILATSFLIMGITVNSIKNITKEERPDGTDNKSFPSGHTATAFMGAEFLWQEYKNVSPWIGIAGYAVAAGTGFFRIYNNRHWLTDVIGGAGMGILSAKAGYWLYPCITKKLFKNKASKNVVALPYYRSRQVGINCIIYL